MAKRGKLEIIKDILGIVSINHGSIRPTPLLRRSKLSSSRFKEYKDELLLKGFIEEKKEEGKKKIVISLKGKRFLDRYKSIIRFIEEFEL